MNYDQWKQEVFEAWRRNDQAELTQLERMLDDGEVSEPAPIAYQWLGTTERARIEAHQ